MRIARFFSGIVAVGASLGLAVACGGSGSGGSNFFGTGGGNGSGTGGSGNGTGTGTGGGMNLGGNGNGTGGGGSNPDAACAKQNFNAHLTPVAMYIMLDKSGSMGQNNKWTNTKNGLQQFVNDPNSKGIKVGLQYFPGNGSCNGSGYNQPKVPLAPLPGNAGPIMNSLNSTFPGGGTPTEGALRGLTQFCKSYEQSHPAEKCVGLLVTDGQPNGCNGSTSYLANIAHQAFTGSPSVMTFVMGMQGASFNVLNAIAQGGGTKQAYNVSTGGAQFVQALQNIAGQILSCSFPMPTTDAGILNTSTMQVTFTSGSNQTSNIAHVTNAGACTASGGFYYDNNTSPTKITLCPATCNTVQSDQSGNINIWADCTSGPPA